MSLLTLRERELVSLGAAMGSNCVSCIEYHIPASKKAGLSDPEISEAIEVADKVRQVPARKTLNVALSLLSESHPAESPGAASDMSMKPGPSRKPCCG